MRRFVGGYALWLLFCLVFAIFAPLLIGKPVDMQFEFEWMVIGGMLCGFAAWGLLSED